MINIQNLNVKFGNNHVLRDINLTLNKGESLVVIGSSGCGKSVLIKTILGIISPQSGKIFIKNQDILTLDSNELAKITQNMSMLFQYSALFDSMNIQENIAFRLIYSLKMPKKQALTIAIDLLTQVGLAESVAWQYPSEISGGMRKRVALARAVAGNPEILFFDEPTAGLDPIMGRIIDDYIQNQVNKLGATAITISHDMAEVRRIANKVAMLCNGNFVWSGLVSELDTTDNPFVRQFVDGKADGPIKY